MRKIVFLNGCINSGKSTVARRLKACAENLAHVEVDDLHRFIDWMPIEKAIHLNLNNAACVTRHFIAAGLDVIYTYPLSLSDYRYVLTQFADVGAECIPITLYTDRAQAKQNRGTRELTPWELDRIDWMHEHGLARPAMGTHIDTTRLSVDETVHQVMQLAGLKPKPRA